MNALQQYDKLIKKYIDQKNASIISKTLRPDYAQTDGYSQDYIKNKVVGDMYEDDGAIVWNGTPTDTSFVGANSNTYYLISPETVTLEELEKGFLYEVYFDTLNLSFKSNSENLSKWVVSVTDNVIEISDGNNEFVFAYIVLADNSTFKITPSKSRPFQSLCKVEKLI